MVSELAIVLISILKRVSSKRVLYSTKLSLSVRSSHAFKPEILWSKAFALESWLLLRWRKKVYLRLFGMNFRHVIYHSTLHMWWKRGCLKVFTEKWLNLTFTESKRIFHVRHFGLLSVIFFTFHEVSCITSYHHVSRTNLEATFYE